jgi:hypothetical protein
MSWRWSRSCTYSTWSCTKPCPPAASAPRDYSQAAKLVIDIATGQVEDRPPTPEEQGKDPAAVKRGRLGGAKGGKARALTLAKPRRVEIAKKAAKTRWKSGAHSE